MALCVRTSAPVSYREVAGWRGAALCTAVCTPDDLQKLFREENEQRHFEELLTERDGLSNSSVFRPRTSHSSDGGQNF